jgi:hypothetical protein
MQSGTGSFVFSDRAIPAGGAIRVFYFCPRSDVRNAPIIIAMHGLDRAASSFRDILTDSATRNGQIVLVPEFDVHQFPDVYAYNFGGVMLSPPGNRVFPRQDWNFGIVDRLFQHVRQLIDSNRTTFAMFGNSAGSQYVLRYLALTEATAVDRAVASNSGVYMLPDLRSEYPVGMGGLDLDAGHLRRYFGRPLVILLGEADTDTLAPDLPRNDIAMAQGPHRLARGRWHFQHCAELASELGENLRWKLEVVNGAGHVSQQIFDRAVDILSGACQPFLTN